MKRVWRSLADLSLRGKVALGLTLVFLGSVGVLLLVLVPFLAEQRQRMLEQDRRLLSVLRRSYAFHHGSSDQLQGPDGCYHCRTGLCEDLIVHEAAQQNRQ